MVAVELSKVVVVIVNLIFLVFGVAILLLGASFKYHWDDVRDAFEDKSEDVDFELKKVGDAFAVSAIVFGSFIAILSLIGCIGGCCNVRFLLAIYAVVVLLLLLTQIGVTAFVAVAGNDAEDDLVKALKDSLHGYREDSEGKESEAWSALFDLVHCCGVVNYTTEFNATDFVMSDKRTALQKAKRPIIPVTCCRDYNYEDEITEDIMKEEKINKCLMEQTSEYAYLEGCETKIKDSIDDSKGILLGVGITIIFIEVVVVIMGFFLACRSSD